MTKGRRRFEKKSEMLEVRLTLSEKQALSAHCKQQGVSASELVRDLLSRKVQQPAWRRFLHTKGQNAMPALHAFLPPAAAAALAGSLALAVTAPSTASDFRAAFDALDADSDGAVTLDEFMNYSGAYMPDDARHRGDGRTISRAELEGEMRSEFAQYDANRNGLMTYAEFSGRYGSVIEAAFEHFDANTDGEVTATELDAGAAIDAPIGERLVSEFDTDSNGALSFAEFSGYRG